jgi:dolichol-phosphate mannosyltransferase
VFKLRNELLPVVRELALHNGIDSYENNPSIEMIFVDDGSRDDTYGILKEHFGREIESGLRFKFLRHENNLGLGAALRTGFSIAEGDIIVSVDSDGTYQFADIPNLLSLLKPGVHIVTASPYHPKGSVVGVPAFRLILSQGSSYIYRILVNRHIYTYTCLFRAYRSEVVKNTQFKSNDFLGGTELLVKAILRGYQVAEFPAILYKRQYGVSKARIAQTILSHLGFQWQVLLFRILSLLGIGRGENPLGNR